MGKKNSAVQAKRQQVLKKHSNAMRKMRRLEKQNGAVVAGTKFDPTRDPSKLKSYTRKQLESYEAGLDNFLSRKTQYVGDAHGRPMVKQLWDRYVRLKKAGTAEANAELEANKNIFLPFAGQTIGDRVKAMSPDRPHMHNPAVHNKRAAVDLKSSRIASQDALETLLADAQEKAKPGHKDRILESWRANFAKIAVDAPPDIVARTNALTDHQFNILWAFTDFVDELSTRYETIGEGKTDAGALKIIKTSENLLGEMLDWAEKL